MADVNVSTELQMIIKRLDKIDTVVVELARLTEQLANNNNRFAEYKIFTDRRIEKMDERIDRLSVKVIYWTGGIAALTTAFGVVMTLLSYIK